MKIKDCVKVDMESDMSGPTGDVDARCPSQRHGSNRRLKKSLAWRFVVPF